MLILTGPTGEHEHDGGALHPERQGRIGAVMDGIEDLRLGRELVSVDAPLAGRVDLERVHVPSYLDELEAFCRHGGGELDPDTFAVADSWEAARRAAGAGLAAVDALRSYEEGVALVVARPPGHHAEPDRAMGFCLLNNVAISAAALVAQGERVLIVDWDVHHGNGTQAIFWDEPNVVYLSTHQWPLFPGTGRVLEVGGPRARGLTINVPLPAGATGDVVDLAIQHVAGPTIERFAPQWVLVSCGFDAHRDDPLGELALSSGDFADLARIVGNMVPGSGRLALFLEGGYDLEALRTSTAATVDALLGGRRQPEPPTAGGPGADLVCAARVARDRAVTGTWP